MMLDQYAHPKVSEGETPAAPVYVMPEEHQALVNTVLAARHAEKTAPLFTSIVLKQALDGGVPGKRLAAALGVNRARVYQIRDRGIKATEAEVAAIMAAPPVVDQHGKPSRPI